MAFSVITQSKLEADATLEPPPELAALGEVTISFADLIMLAGVEATSFTGGPDFSIPLGRPDALVPDSLAELPTDATLVEAQKALFLSNGYSVRELVTLEGAHTLGFSRLHPFKGPMTSTPLTFDNGYYIELLKGGGLFPSDSSLIKDPETAQIVIEFGNDQNAFFKSWELAFRNMSIKGVPLQNLRGGL